MRLVVCPEHSTLGDAKSSVNVRVRVGFSFGSFFNIVHLCGLLSRGTAPLQIAYTLRGVGSNLALVRQISVANLRL